MHRRISKVLVANRGEIAVRIIRAAKDSGIASVAVYSDQDAQALFAQLADEAFALRGTSPAETYLDAAKILTLAERSGADAIHPGYGFLAENADFARAVEAAGLIWIGPPPAAIDALGDKVSARHIAKRVGAPLAPGTTDPVAGADEVVAFAQQVGLPVAIKAAFGGGGRGLKVARTLEEIPELFESATRESVTAFGRGECFVERFLENPRHVETQCLADVHGNVVVVSTRDCSLQRRHQKVVEEAPAPFLTEETERILDEASRAIMAESGYVGAGTCEFLIGADGTIAFLEVNTRLQVEHPVTEEVTGVDLVREQFRIAEGASIADLRPVVRGHAFEFRINAEDPGMSFMPAPGTITSWQPPTGPGVRVDEGYHAGMQIPGEFDSLISKLIVTGATREQAMARARRALAEIRLEGPPTTLAFHRAVLEDPAFTAPDGEFNVHTGWIENGFTGHIPPHQSAAADAQEPAERESIVVEVDGRRLEVTLPAGLGRTSKPTSRRPGISSKPAAAVNTAAPARTLRSPMHCKVVSVLAPDGTMVQPGDPVLVVEAMKMEQSMTAPCAGVVSGLTVAKGDSISAGALICEVLEPA